PVAQFGNGARSAKTPPANVARGTVKVKPTDIAALPTLPERNNAAATTARNVRIVKPIAESGSMNTTAQVGAAPRTESVPLDTKLRERTIYGGRTPVPTR